jgi:hypothetical protein
MASTLTPRPTIASIAEPATETDLKPALFVFVGAAPEAEAVELDLEDVGGVDCGG